MDEIDIAAISFAYKNASVIELLKKRGALLTNGKFEELTEIED